jgi:hypothetical protein
MRSDKQSFLFAPQFRQPSIVLAGSPKARFRNLAAFIASANPRISTTEPFDP